MDLYDIRSQLNTGKTIYDLKLRVTYYARVSTDKDEQLHSLQAQINYYTEFIKQNTNWVFVEGYIDEGLSGTNVSKRESFLSMIEDAKLKKFDFIITKEISRFSRNTLDSIKYTQQLLSYGVGVFFQSDNINTLMPDAELRLTIMSSIAQDEVRKLSERVKFGFKRAIENGVVLGSNKIWGYRKDKGKLVIEEEEAKVVRLIYDLYANQRMGMRSICNLLTDNVYKNKNGNAFTFSTVRGILSNPKYKGYYCGNKSHKYDYKLNDRKIMDESEWVLYKDVENVPPIVSEELWERANTILKCRGKQFRDSNVAGYNNKYAYSGKIICTEHNVPFYRRMYKYKSGKQVEIWACKLYTERGKSGCESPTIYTSEIDEIMRQSCDMIIENKSEIIHDMLEIYSSISNDTEIKSDISKCEVEINNILKKKDKLLDLSIKDRITDNEFEIRNNRFNDEIDKLKIKIEQLKEDELKNKNINESLDNLRKIISNELDFKNGFDVGLIDSLLDRIEVYKTNDKHKIDLKVYFKLLDKEMKYTINRSRKETSVCNEQYILNISNRSFTFQIGPERFNRQFTKSYNVKYYMQLAV